jgi:hypothetical protein
MKPPQIPMTCTTAVDPGPVFLRRLTHVEYRRAVRDLTGVTTDYTKDFPSETAINGYRNNAEGIPASTLQTEKYADAAAKIADELVKSNALLANLLPGCTLSGSGRGSCLDKMVRSFGLRVFRRPLTGNEAERYIALGLRALDDPNPNAIAGLVVQAMLQSPNFLYRVEVGAGGPAEGHADWLKLDGYEIASRLSFLISGTVPNAALLDAAANHQLDTLEGVRAAAQTLMTDTARVQEATREFYYQWLGFDVISHLDRDPMDFPKFNDGLRMAMAEEAKRFVDSVLWEPGGSMLHLLDANYSFLNPTLATHYGKTMAPTEPWTKVTFEDADERGGLLGLGGLLAATWKLNVDPILRGKYVREGLLCEPPPPPPPNVGPLPMPMPNESERQRLERHRKDPSCSSCHEQFDPIGFGLERYDGIGALRTKDSQGQDLTGAGRLEGTANPDFKGMRELATRLAAMPEFSSCAVTQMFRYAFARSDQPTDACTIQQINEAFTASGHRYPDLIMAIVSHDVFRHRRADAGEQK